MSKPKRQYVREEIDLPNEIDITLLDGGGEDLRGWLGKVNKALTYAVEHGYKNIYVVLEGDLCGYEESGRLKLLGEREETDKEYSKRIKQERKLREKRKIEREKVEEMQRQRYEKLKKKFESSVK